MATIARSRRQPSRLTPITPPPTSALLSGLDDTAREEFLGSSTSHRYGRHQVVFCEGERLQSLFWLESGSVKLVQHSAEGKELIVALVPAGGSFGPAVTPRDSRVMAQALETSVVIAIPLASVRTQLSRHPEAAASLIDQLELGQTKLHQVASELAFESVPYRLARLLLRESEHDTGEMLFPLNQTELANLIGSSRETVCSILNRMRRDGLIEMHRGRVRIEDRHGIAEVR